MCIRDRPKEVRQVISQETSDLVRSYMESVVNDPGGTGKNAKVEGYHIGGKTGSSQTLDSKDHIIVSFLGFAPADDPEVIVLLGYDWPQPAAPGAVSYTHLDVYKRQPWDTSTSSNGRRWPLTRSLSVSWSTQRRMAACLPRRNELT